jgi:hypothetical protein
MTPRFRFGVIAVTWLLGSVAAVYAAFHARYNLSNIDGISYMSIARQYAEGHSDAAVNAYWSPLVSWLMAPLMAAGIDDVLAFDLVTAGTVIIGGALIARLVWLRAGCRVLLTLGVLISFFVFALGNLFVLTPDMLVVVWVLLFVTVLLEVDDRFAAASTRARVVMGVVLGVVGALGYVTKLYLVPVFGVTLIVWLLVRVLHQRRGDRRPELLRLLTLAGVVVLALAVVSGPWIGILTAKYGAFTVGSSLNVNVDAKFDPDAGETPAGPPVLYAPPNEYAVSFGEDRTAQVATAPSGDGSTSSGSSSGIGSRIAYYTTQRVAAFPYYLTRIGSIAPFAVIGAVLTVLALLFAGSFRGRRDVGLVGIVWGVYFLGYAAVTTVAGAGGNSRYYWPLLILSLLMIAFALPELWRRLVDGRARWRAVAFLLIVALVPAGVLWQHGVGKGAPFSTEAPLASTGYLFHAAEPGHESLFATETLAPLIPPGSKIVGSNYRASLRLTYYLHGQIYGRAAQGYRLDDPVFQGLMRDAGIDFYLRFTPVGTPAADLGGAGEIIGTFQQRTTCTDEKTAQVEDCTIDVIKLG